MHHAGKECSYIYIWWCPSHWPIGSLLDSLTGFGVSITFIWWFKYLETLARPFFSACSWYLCSYPLRSWHRIYISSRDLGAVYAIIYLTHIEVHWDAVQKWFTAFLLGFWSRTPSYKYCTTQIWEIQIPHWFGFGTVGSSRTAKLSEL